ncbi:MAG: CoA-binding protein, partial [Bacteroidia bacterium]|nr:CoA-binding protein [Bacteroidia bacterium]
MLNKQLLAPKSILVVGASNNITKPGGKILKNLIEHEFKGRLYAFNPNDPNIQGVKTYNTLDELPEIDLAILAIPAKSCPDMVEQLATKKKVCAFIVISGGFSEMGKEGEILEKQMVASVNKTGGCLIGPNCIGMLTPNYAGVFTTPIPQLELGGCDFVSGSGATSVFILESAIPKGLHFSSVISVGNSAQIGVEEVLEYWDLHSGEEISSRVKLLYIES